MDVYHDLKTGMFSCYKYLFVNLVISHLGFRSGNLFLIAPFPDLCLLVPFLKIHIQCKMIHVCSKASKIESSLRNMFYHAR